MMLHAGFLPEPGSSDRKPFLDTLGTVSRLAAEKGITIAFETGQETADLLRLTLDELRCPNLKVNFDPANVLLYDKGDPIRAVEILGPDIRSVHVKDANRPEGGGAVGRRSAARRGAGEHAVVREDAQEGRLPRAVVHRAARSATRNSRVADIAHGIRYLQQCLAD